MIIFIANAIFFVFWFKNIIMEYKKQFQEQKKKKELAKQAEEQKKLIAQENGIVVEVPPKKKKFAICNKRAKKTPEKKTVEEI